MPYRSMMQIAGQATKIKAQPVLDLFDKNLDLRNLILRYLHLVLTQAIGPLQPLPHTGRAPFPMVDD